MKEKIFLYYNLETLEEEGRIALDGLRGKSRFEELEKFVASIKDLNRDLEEQKTLLKIGYHPDGYLVPKGKNGEILVLKEGEFIWNSNNESYEKI